jgi:thioredoxin-related protein
MGFNVKRVSKSVFSSVALGFLVIALSLICGVGTTQAADELALTRAVDLQADAKEAAAKKIPLVLMSNLTGCHYCRGALREVLLPMQRDAGWARTALYRQIDVDKKTPMKDFDGKLTTHEAFTRKMKLEFAPTILVVDGGGKPLAEPIVGIATWDYYGYTVEEAIRKGFTASQAQK